MNISIQQTNNIINNKLKRCSSLENIVVSNDSHIYQSQRSLQPQHLDRNKQSQANDLLPLLGKDSAVVNVRSLTDGGNRANGNQLSHRLYIQQHNSRNNYINNKSTACVPTIKRAKSMDTLVFQDDNDKGRQPSNCSFHHQIPMPETPISNDLQLVDENVLIIENTNNFINQCQNRTSDDKLIQSTMKSASNLNNEPIDELPKPDTVKTYKRIFEPINMTNGEEIGKTGINNKSKNNYKKTQTQTPTNGNIKRKPPVLRATDKIASQKTQSIVNSLSPTIKPQPPAVPQVLSSPHSISDSAVVGDNDKNNNKSANTSVMTKPPIAPKNIALSSIKSNPFSGMSAAPINKYFKKNGSFANTKRAVHYSSNDNNNITTGPKKPERGLKSISTEALDRIRASGTSVTFKGPDQSSTPCPVSQTSATAHDSSDSTPNKPKVNKPIANIKPFTQNNNSKSKIVDNCQSVISDYNGSDLGHDKPLENEKPIGEKASVETNYTNNNNNKDDKENNKIAAQSVIPTTTPTLTSTTDLIEKSNNENSVSVNDENVSPNTYDMVDRNKVQRIEDHTQTDVLKPSLLLNTGHSNNTSNKSPTSSLWSQETKKPTTVVFDFRGKDVKSNLAIHPTPFGLSTSATKKTPKDGSINSNGSVDEDEDDNYTGSLDIPLPSGITFTGENVKVGKGSILSTRNKKLNIQFNDSATSTYEYPSEASLLAETPISSHTSTLEEVNYENKSETNNSVIACESSNTNTTLTTLKTNLALGGSSGGLASYKPTLIDTPFELGVSRTTKSHPKSETAVNEHNSETNTEADSVKPANPDETTSWSTSSTASDLLF